MLRLAITVAGMVAAAAAQIADPDRDGDGLSDFCEVHKYRTDPDRADSDGDGIPDGDWRERREFTYVVRTVVQVMRPVTVDHLCDDYQDARVLDDAPGHVELEVIHYPFSTAGDDIPADPDWRATAARMGEWTRPGPTADWTPAMRDELVAALRADGIDPDALDDRTLVQEAAAWLLRRAEYHDGFTTFVTAFAADGSPFIPGALLPGVEPDRRGSSQTLEQQWQREISARGMFTHRARGSCTSTAIYLNGCLRALGIPTRVILCIPVADASDARERELLARGLTHAQVRGTVLPVIETMRSTWASHTFNEVFVAGRWRRLNGDRLGQGILDPQLFGLITHVATFGDWAEARMPDTVGRRQQQRPAGDVFGGANPYSMVTVRDRIGPHSTLPRPEPIQTAVSALWWTDGAELPEQVRANCAGRGRFGLIARIEASGAALRVFLANADLEVKLRADGAGELGSRFDTGCWWGYPEGYTLIYLPLGAAARRDLRPGARYRLEPRNAAADWRWKVGDLAVVRR